MAIDMPTMVQVKVSYLSTQTRMSGEPGEHAMDFANTPKKVAAN